MFGVQGWGALVFNSGLKKAAQNAGPSFLKATVNSDEFSKWTLANADRMSRAAMDGVQFSQNVMEMSKFNTDWLERDIIVGKRPVLTPEGEKVLMGGKPLMKGGVNVQPFAPTIRLLDKLQFQRMVTMWKLDTYEIARDMLNAGAKSGGMLNFARNAHVLVGNLGKTDRERGIAAANFTNNLYGGLNSAAQGRSAARNLLESVFVLTPGFTRGGLGIAAKTLGTGPEAALARDFAVRGYLMASAMVYGLTLAMNGMGANLPMPNVSDPTKNDWMDIPLPGGARIRPMSRFRSMAQTTISGLAEAIDKKDPRYFTDNVLQWAAYRQSGLISAALGDPIGGALNSTPFANDTGNPFAAGSGLWDVLMNPSTDRQRDVGQFGAQFAPILGQQVIDPLVAGRGFEATVVGFAANAFGQTAIEPTPDQRRVVEAAAIAAEGILPEDVIASALRNNQLAINAKEDDGSYILGSRERAKLVSTIAKTLDMDEETVRRTGREPDRQLAVEAEAMKNQRVDTYFSGQQKVDEEYAQKLAGLEEGVKTNKLSLEDYSKKVTELRKMRAAGKDAVEAAAPDGLQYLLSPEYAGRKNRKDVLFSAISTEVYSKDYYDPLTGTFDFEARDADTQRIKAKYGPLYDQWKKRADDKKTPLERERDSAMERLSVYFDAEKQVWKAMFGGKLGDSRGDLAATLFQQFKKQGYKDEDANLLVSRAFQSSPALKNATATTARLKEAMRRRDPQLDLDVRRWLGNMPLKPL